MPAKLREYSILPIILNFRALVILIGNFCSGFVSFYSTSEKKKYDFSQPYPFILVNVGSGVSVLAVWGPTNYKRISGTRYEWMITKLAMAHCTDINIICTINSIRSFQFGRRHILGPVLFVDRMQYIRGSNSIGDQR